MKSSKKLPKFEILESVKDLEKINLEELKSSKNTNIIFDTNFLFVPFDFKLDLISELNRIIGRSFNLLIYEGTLNELENIEKKKNKNKRFLPLISKMLYLYKFKIIKDDEIYVDDVIINNLNKFKKENTFVATNDRALKKKIKEKGFKVIYVRQKRYLEID